MGMGIKFTPVRTSGLVIEKVVVSIELLILSEARSLSLINQFFELSVTIEISLSLIAPQMVYKLLPLSLKCYQASGYSFQAVT
jgi:hypothetical protein